MENLMMRKRERNHPSCYYDNCHIKIKDNFCYIQAAYEEIVHQLFDIRSKIGN